jgi:hypothetical protein
VPIYISLLRLDEAGYLFTLASPDRRDLESYDRLDLRGCGAEYKSIDDYGTTRAGDNRSHSKPTVVSLGVRGHTLYESIGS